MEVTNKLKLIFATHGIPKTVICDNVPFNSRKMKEFAREWGFDIITSIPCYPKSNGYAEKLVAVAKSIFRKAGVEKLNEALLEYRNTPISGTDLSSSQMLLSRQVRTRLPITQIKLEPEVQNQFREKLVNKQKQAKFYYDKHARERPEFVPGEKVMLWRENKWEPAVIVKRYSTPRSYWVKTKENRVIRRNKCHLRKTKNQKDLVFSNYYDLCDENEENLVTHNDSHHQVNNNNNSNNSIVTVNNNSNSNVYKTRSGRNVCRPSKYNNYVLH